MTTTQMTVADARKIAQKVNLGYDYCGNECILSDAHPQIISSASEFNFVVLGGPANGKRKVATVHVSPAHPHGKLIVSV